MASFDYADMFNVDDAPRIAEYNRRMRKYRTVFDRDETAEEITDKCEGYFRKFFTYAAETSLIYPYEELLKEDCIDVINTRNHEYKTIPTAYPAYKVAKDEEQYCKEHPYCIFPPMELGLLKINKSRWILFKLDNIDTKSDQKSFTVLLQDYRISRKLTILDRVVDVKVTWENKHVFYTANGNITLNDLFLSEPSEKIFNEKDRIYWDTLVIPKAKETIARTNRELTSTDEHLINSFIRSIIFTNYQLSKSKVTANRKASRKIKATPDPSGKKPKKQLIRNVGDSGIVITSVDIPREATEDRIIKYKVASWNTRGHERKLKSGKVVWVRQSVHHRKCLEKSDPLQTEIQIREVTA